MDEDSTLQRVLFELVRLSIKSDESEYKRGVQHAIDVLSRAALKTGKGNLRSFILNTTRHGGYIMSANDLTIDTVLQAKKEERTWFDQVTGHTLCWLPRQIPRITQATMAK